MLQKTKQTEFKIIYNNKRLRGNPHYYINNIEVNYKEYIKHLDNQQAERCIFLLVNKESNGLVTVISRYEDIKE